MEEKDWVYEFIEKLFDTDIEQDGLALRDSKLNYINLPLYKYCYVCEEAGRSASTIDYNIDNFENEVLFFQNPSKFNDPFDCYLGFSQTQIIRDLVIHKMKTKKQLTPQKRKLISSLFNEEDTFNIELLTIEELQQVINAIFSLIPENDPLKSAYNEILDTMLAKGKSMIKKLITNTLTIKDKQELVDEMYNNPIFQECIKKDISTDNFEFIMKAAPHDLKFNIENNPDSFMSDYNGELLGIFDIFKIFTGSSSFNDLTPTEVDLIKQKFNEVSGEVLTKTRNIISEQFRISCLSESMNSPLMWSHYANKHYGFCLEYDFTLTLTERRYPDLLAAQLFLFPVHYSEKRPLISRALFDGKNIANYIKYNRLPPDFLKKLMYGLLYKSEEWAYEKEWRIFQLPSEKPIMRLPKPRKIFLGANIEETPKKRLIEIASKKHIPIYQMFLHSDKYKFDYYQIKD